MVKASAKAQDSFYKELDQSKGAGGCCSLTSIVIASVIMLIIGTIVIISLGRHSLGITLPKGSNLSLSLGKLSGSGQTSNTPTTTFTVRMSNDQFNEVLRQAAIPHTKDLVTNITPQRIEIHGTITEGVDLPLYVAIIPKATSDGSIHIDVEDVTVAGVRTLPLLTDAIRAQLANGLNSFIQSKFHGIITNIQLEQGELVATLSPII